MNATASAKNARNQRFMISSLSGCAAFDRAFKRTLRRRPRDVSSGASPGQATQDLLSSRSRSLAHVIGERRRQRTQIALELRVSRMRLERRLVHVQRALDLDLHAVTSLVRAAVPAG